MYLLCKNEHHIYLVSAPLALSSLADNVYRKCLENGTWALKGNYSMCTAILDTVRLWCVEFECTRPD